MAKTIRNFGRAAMLVGFLVLFAASHESAGKAVAKREWREILEIKRFLIEDQMKPVSHYCHSVRAGELIWVSGIVGMTADGHIPEDTKSQFDIALDAMDVCLRAAGGRPHTVTKVQIFLTDISERGLINPARETYFGKHRPASTLVEVSALVDPRMKVEIECMGIAV